jgi:hypothetical protein
MTNHLKNLKQHQKWRRTGKVAAMHPEDIGKAIDYAISVCEAAENLVAVKGRHHSEQAYARLADAVANA